MGHRPEFGIIEIAICSGALVCSGYDRISQATLIETAGVTTKRFDGFPVDQYAELVAFHNERKSDGTDLFAGSIIHTPHELGVTPGVGPVIDITF